MKPCSRTPGRTRARSRRRLGFTLIELLAVMAIIAILISALAIQVPKYLDRAKVSACSLNMTDLYRNFQLYKDRFKDWPNQSGIRFFLELWRVDTESHSENFAKRFTCPGVQPRLLGGLGDRTPEHWFDDWENLDETYTAYAGRDVEHFPHIDKTPGKQALVACDNEFADTEQDPVPNHSYTTNVLMADGAPKEYDVELLRRDGVIAPNAYLIPGPDCPVEELRSLRRDAPLLKKK